MPPKKPEQLRREIEQQQEQPAVDGTERTAEGEQVRTPDRGEFFANLGRLAEPEKKR